MRIVQWVKVSKTILVSDVDTLFGCVYIPPENTKYSSAEAYDEVENELLSLVKTNKSKVALIGDFNAKTGTLYCS